MTNEQLKSWALPYSTRDKGDCAGVTRQLLAAIFGNYASDEPTERKKKAVHIPLRDKTSHVGVLLRWRATGDEVIVDATIRQFGGDQRVFVGSYDDRVAPANAGRYGHMEGIDADFGFMYDVLDTLNTMPAVERNDLRRSRGSASVETHQAGTLGKGCGGCRLL